MTSLIGSVVVTPSTARPCEPVFIQVRDGHGQPYTDDTNVRITIQNVECHERYMQFAQPGDRTLVVQAAAGGTFEQVEVALHVIGASLTFKRTVAGEPTVTEIPMLSVQQSIGSPYVATFTLETPREVRVALAAQHPPQAAAGGEGRIRPRRSPVARERSCELISVVAEEFTRGSLERAVLVAPTSVTRDGVTITKSSASGVAQTRVSVPLQATSYEWDFGDGQQMVTQAPTATHDYFPAIRPDRVAHVFHVRCTVRHETPPRTVLRTLVLYSAYGLSKQTGVIVPHVCDSDVYATYDGSHFSASMIVNNIEAQSITLTHSACVPHKSDPDARLAAPDFKKMAVPMTMGAASATGIAVFIPVDQLFPAAGYSGTPIPGFAVHYKGVAEDGSSVRFSRAFLVSGSDARDASAGPTMPTAGGMRAMLPKLRQVLAGPGPLVTMVGNATFDPDTNTVAVALATRKSTLSARVQFRAAAGALAVALRGKPQEIPRRSLFAPPPPRPGPVEEGEICDPIDISDADKTLADQRGLACQIVGEAKTYRVEASFRNALKGDIIISPGGAGEPIATLLRALDPPQQFSHSGIMSRNFFEICHCTAAGDRIVQHTRGGGLGGLEPAYLQYAWPGSIRQNVRNATAGEVWIDPIDKARYTIAGFRSGPVDVFTMTPPMVLKPLPENEEVSRPILRKVAETARERSAYLDDQDTIVWPDKGYYYCFYGYTKPEIALDGGSPAPPSAGWAAGRCPAVCSSFIWLCMKEHDQHLVTAHEYTTPGDLDDRAVEQGAQVGAATLDGLFYYTQAERINAGKVLAAIFREDALSAQGLFRAVPVVSPAVAEGIANQVLNMFAFDNPDMPGYDWKVDPGTGNAVSPENITWWKPPLLGYEEPLQYLQAHDEIYQESRWVKVPVDKKGSVCGTVRIDGVPVSGALVYIFGWQTVSTDASGRYSLKDCPLGSYVVKAQKVQNNFNYTGACAVSLTAANPDIVADLDLKGLSEDFRQLDLTWAWQCYHSDDNPGNQHGWCYLGAEPRSVRVGPGNWADSTIIVCQYGNGGYFTIEYEVYAALLPDRSIDTTVTGRMYSDSDTKPQRTVFAETSTRFNVLAGGQGHAVLDLQYAAASYGNGPSTFTLTANNNQETT